MPGVIFQVEHVRYWRGSIHRWSTKWQYSGERTGSMADAATLVMNNDDEFCWGADATDGGTASCSAYDSAGGPPLATVTRFDWETPASWIKYAGTFWGSQTGSSFNSSAEIALQVEWNAGTSKTGKPVRLRKWFHAVPDRPGSGTTPDVGSGTMTGLVAGANGMRSLLTDYGLQLGTPAGRLAGNASVLPYYGNHQMPRGRRRKPLVTASGRYTGPTLNQVPIIAD